MTKGLAEDMQSSSSSESQAAIHNHSFTRIKNIFDILRPVQNNEEYKPKVIMIEGALGMGKTTLCKEIAYQWAKNQSLAHYKIIFFVSLHNLIISKIKSLEDFILYFYNFDEEAAVFAKQCAGILHKRNNSDILVILDGHDISQVLAENVFLAEVVHHKLFEQSKIIITSQSVATNNLQDIVGLRIEILGFSDENKKEYIESTFQNFSNEVKILSSYLNANKDINDICYVPMIMDIFVQAYKETKELPENQTDLYQKIVYLLIIKYAQRFSEQIPCQSSTLLLQDLPEVYKSYLIDLSKAAFDFFKSDKIVFTDADLKVVNPNFTQNHTIQGLGLLKSTQHFQTNSMKVCTYYNFLHSSIQVFLAAYYVSTQNACNQFELLKNTFFNHKYTNVWIVFAGLNKCAFLEFLNYSTYCRTCHISESLIKDVKNLDVLRSFPKLIKECTCSNHRENFQLFCIKTTETKYYNTLCLKNTVGELMIMNKLMSIKVAWNKIYLSLHHDSKPDKEVIETFVVDKNMQENVYSRLASDLNENKNLSVMIINVSSMLGYRANKQQISSGLNMNDCISNLFLTDCFISDEISIMMSSYIEKSKLKVVVFIECTFSNMGIKNTFSSLSRIVTIEIMVIGNMNIDEETAIPVASAIVNNTKMYFLEIVNCHLQSEAAFRIITALKNISSLGTLILENNNFSKDITDDLAAAICVNYSLKKLKLGNNNLQHHAAVLAQALCQTKLLTNLDLSNNNMTDKGADALSLAIESNTSLERVNLKGNALKTNGIIKIAQSLSWNSKLKVIDICNNQITEEAADAIAIAILSNRNLEELYLDNNSVGLGVHKIAATLKEVSTLKVLNLDNNNASDIAADELAAVVCSNKLEKLFLVNNNLKSGAIKICWALTKITTLTVLHLSKNGMTEEVACSLAAAIESNHLLTTIKLSNNKLQTKGIKTISQSLKKLSSLQVLHIDRNQISKAAANDIASVVLSNSCLKELYLNDNDLQDGIIEIANALKSTSALQKLVLNDNNMPENVSDALSDALKNMYSLQVFAAMNNKLTTKAIVTIAKSLSCISGLTILNIHNNQLTTLAEDAIASVIENNKTLEEVYLGENDFTGAGKIVASLKDAYALKKININDCGMFENVAKDLEIALANKHSLNTVGLEGNYLRSDGVITIAKSLRCISNLTLHNNQLTEEAGEAVASIILSNTKLEDLYLGNNKLQTGAMKVVLALKHISTLKVLDLNDNIITEYVADELASAIDCNPLVNTLRLRSNRLKTVGTIKIFKSLAKLTSLKSLNMRNNEITEEASEAIVSLLLSNTEIEELYLGCNYVEGGIVKILTALKNNSVIKLLDLDGNNLCENAGSEIISAVQSNTLEKLWLAKNSLHSLKNVHVQDLHPSMKLTELDFNDNFLSGNVAQECTTAIISSNSLLECVLLQNNCFSTEEWLQILLSLSKLSTLKFLNIKGNLITLELADVIALVIRNNTGLEELYLNCDYLQHNISKITESLNKLSKLRILDICGGNVSEKVIHDLMTIIQSNCLQSLQLIESNLKLSASTIAQAISHITCLTVLNLSSNSISEEVANDLAAAITNNQSLKGLRLVDNYLKSNGAITIIIASIKQPFKFEVIESEKKLH